MTSKFHRTSKVVKIKNLGDHDPQQCNHKLNGQYIHYKKSKATEGKEMVPALYPDGTKELFVPSREPVDTPAILGQTEFERLKKKAHVVTLKDRMQMLDDAAKEKTRLLTESAQRKEQLFKAQQEQKAMPGSKLETVESEATKKNLYLLRRSKELVIEQDERVKQANGIILATKCRAIRNAQIAEKRLLEKKLKEEEMRLDTMMEQRRQKLIEIEEKRRENEEKKKQHYVQEIQSQIKQNDLDRLLEAEKIEEESRMLNRALIELQKEEEARMKEKHELQKKMREEFKRANEEAQHYKDMIAEEQRIADMRVQEFMRQKAEREEQREKEQAFIKATKEKEIAKLRAMQQKSQDIRAALDEMNALRAQEEKEKEWREQEKIAAQKRKQLADDLKKARAQQIQDIRRAQAVSLARDEQDFLKVAKVQQEIHQKEMAKLEKKKLEIEKHRKELLKQINEKERENLAYEQERFEDGKNQRLEFALKDRDVEEYLKQKIDNLRECNLPESYIADIERQLKLGNKEAAQ